MSTTYKGTLTAPESREVSRGNPVLRFTLDTHEGPLSCVAWGNTAKAMLPLKDGQGVEVEARRVTRIFGRAPITEYIVSKHKPLKP